MIQPTLQQASGSDRHWAEATASARFINEGGHSRTPTSRRLLESDWGTNQIDQLRRDWWRIRLPIRLPMIGSGSRQHFLQFHY
jgi:hypothetical protein